MRQQTVRRLWLRLSDVEGLTFFCSDEHQAQAVALLMALQAGGGVSKGRLIKDLLGTRATSASDAAWELGYLFAIGFANESAGSMIEVSFPGGLSSMNLDVDDEMGEERNEGTHATTEVIG